MLDIVCRVARGPGSRPVPWYNGYVSEPTALSLEIVVEPFPFYVEVIANVALA